MPVIGFLSGRSPYESSGAVAAFRQGLDETGYFESKNVVIEYRWLKADTIGCQRWRQNWSAARLRSSQRWEVPAQD